jgi:glycine cleavage system aminomethyltransferase T
MVDKNFSKLGLNLLVKINGQMRKAKIVEKPFFDPKKSLPSS